MKDVRVKVESEYPTVELLATQTVIAEIAAGGTADLSKQFKSRFTAGAGDYAPARIVVKMTAGASASTENVEVMVAPDGMTAPLAVEVLDGRTVTLQGLPPEGQSGRRLSA